ncbi:hypothetical protein ACFL3X_01385 [Gemmatimonadota bacterium]
MLAHHSVYQNESDALASIEELGTELSRPRNFSSSDIAVFLSLFAPGLGQLQKGKPTHAILTAGLVAGTVLYGMSIPKPDEFRFPSLNYQAIADIGSASFRYEINGVEVSQSEYYTSMNTDWEHHQQAAGERRAARIRKTRAVGLFCAAYLFNLADVVLLSRKDVDASSFFLSVEPGYDENHGWGNSHIRLQLRLLFR